MPGRYNTLAHAVGGTMTRWAGWSWRFREDDFRVLSTRGRGAGRGARGLAGLVRGARALLRAGRARVRRLRARRRESVHAAALGAVSEPAASAAALEPDLRARRQARRPASVSGADRDQSAALRRTRRLHLGRRLPGLRLHDPREGNLAVRLHPARARHRAARSARPRARLRAAGGRRRPRARRALSRCAGPRAGGARASRRGVVRRDGLAAPAAALALGEVSERARQLERPRRPAPDLPPPRGGAAGDGRAGARRHRHRGLSRDRRLARERSRSAASSAAAWWPRSTPSRASRSATRSRARAIPASRAAGARRSSATCASSRARSRSAASSRICRWRRTASISTPT